MSHSVPIFSPSESFFHICTRVNAKSITGSHIHTFEDDYRQPARGRNGVLYPLLVLGMFTVTFMTCL